MKRGSPRFLRAPSPPSYAQATASLYSELLYDGELLFADGKSLYAEAIDYSQATFFLWAGAMNRMAVARKHNTKEVYVIATAIEPMSNLKGNAMNAMNATIVLPGDANITLLVETRTQGSVYMLDRTLPTPKLVQLDAWHESSHPWYWSTEVVQIEAELADLMRARGVGCTYSDDTEPCTPLDRVYTTPFSIDRRVDATGILDYRGGYTSFVRVTANTTVEYDVHLPVKSGTKRTRTVFVWVRVRPGSGGTSSAVVLDLSVSLSSRVTSVTVGGSALMPWRWERLPSTQHSETESVIKLSPRHGTLELDKLVVTHDALWRPPIN